MQIKAPNVLHISGMFLTAYSFSDSSTYKAYRAFLSS